MKSLVLIAHPHLENSRVNKRWKQELEHVPDTTVHDLYEQYPDERIDIVREQELLLSHDRIIFQFPMYWYSSPPLLKKWQDEVLTYGWAYGPEGNKLHGKELVLAISAGGPEHSYRAGGYNNYTISELTRPFQQTANLTGMAFLPHFLQYQAIGTDDEGLNQSAEAYVKHIANEELNPQIRLGRLLKQMNEDGVSL